MTAGHDEVGLARPALSGESRLAFALLCIACTLPLLAVDLPPLVDLYGHLGRFAVQTELAARPELQPFYSYSWKLIGNLGADLLVQALHPFLGLEGALRAVVIATQLLAGAGILAVSRAVHGRITPFAVFALPLIYGLPFNYGFLNFSLAMALALLAFAVWLRLHPARPRAALVWLGVAGGAIWLCHTYGWAFLGLLTGAAMLAEVRATRHDAVAGLRRTLGACWPLLWPAILMAAWRAEAGATITGGWSLARKVSWLISPLRTEWMWLDLASTILLVCLLYWAARSAIVRFDRRLGIAALLAFGCFLALPNYVFGSAYADMRLVPYGLALALLAIAPEGLPARTARALAGGALAFLVLRMVSTGLAYAEDDREIAAYLPAIEAMPRGARVAFIAVKPCEDRWALPVLDHLGGIALARRAGFVNDQWQAPGVNPLTVHYPAARPFAADPSQLAKPDGCTIAGLGPPLSLSLAALPRRAFTHVWIVGALEGAAPPAPGLIPLRHGGEGWLYAVEGAMRP
jgi:hypothetical protein